jgi:hypothetical protein
MMLNRALTPILLCFAFSVQAQPCKVLDPELQGIYSGACVNGLAEGEGFAKGSAEYRGGFKAGRKDGRGVKTWPNGDRYEGEFVADRGKGPWQGERYDGAFAGDRREGYGIYWWPNGDVYAGPWGADTATGPGTEMMRSRAKHASEARTAVAKRGQRVCREVAFGIGGRDWLRGEVVDVEGDYVGVRIEEAGRAGIYPRGEVLWDAAPAWTPCW